MSFIEELWQSVFTPGTTPALIKATHGSFALLIASLIWLIYLSRSIHFVNLLVIALLLYGTVFWCIGELERKKLMSNEELDKASENASEKDASGKSTATENTGTEKKTTKRKV